MNDIIIFGCIGAYMIVTHFRVRRLERFTEAMIEAIKKDFSDDR